MSAQDVATHYNVRRDVGIRERNESNILRLRNFNNWVKSVLLNGPRSRLRPGAVVLDLSCGKFGDLRKWDKAGVAFVVAADIAGESVKQAKERWRGRGRCDTRFGAFFITADCHVSRLADHLPRDMRFDMVSCQFSLHYAFGTRERACRFMENVADRLRPGAAFVGTTTDARVLVKKARESPDGRMYKTDIFHVRFAEEARPLLDGSAPWPHFGVKFNFWLDGVIDECDEYIVHFDTLADLADQHGLDLEYMSNFQDFYHENCTEKSNRDLLDVLKVFDDKGNFPAKEWEAERLYLAFIFRKRGEDTEPRPDPKLWPKQEEILNLLDS